MSEEDEDEIDLNDQSLERLSNSLKELEFLTDI